MFCSEGGGYHARLDGVYRRAQQLSMFRMCMRRRFAQEGVDAKPGWPASTRVLNRSRCPAVLTYRNIYSEDTHLHSQDNTKADEA